MQRRTGDIWGTMADAALVGACCVYARWLDEHKDLEPDHTWLEVTAGVTMCLLHASIYTRVAGGSHEINVWRAFALGGTPIIAGELAQWRKRVRDRQRYEALRQ